MKTNSPEPPPDDVEAPPIDLEPDQDVDPYAVEAEAIDPRPRELDAERAVLGAMMSSPAAVAEVVPLLVARDFYRWSHGVIFTTIVSLFEDGEPTDYLAVATRLRRDGVLFKVGGGPALHSMYDAVTTVANVGYHAGLVATAAARSRLVDLSQRIAQLATHEADELGDVQERVRAAVEEAVAAREDAESGVWVGDVIDEQIESWDEEDDSGLPWPFADVEEVTHGMKPGQLILVAARPGVGKSTLAMDCARHAAKEKQAVLFASLEMSRPELVMRLTCAEARVRESSVKARDLDADDRMRIRRAAGVIAQMPLRIEDRSNMTLGQLRALAREMARGPHGLDLLIVDYLQLLTAADARASRREQVDVFSRGLKRLAKELSVPIMAVAQLNRGPEQRTDKKPALADLRESGSLEQDADMVMLIHRPDSVDREDPRAGEVDLILAKHRGGPTATITVAHQLYWCRFSDLARGAETNHYDERKDLA